MEGERHSRSHPGFVEEDVGSHMELLVGMGVGRLADCNPLVEGSLPEADILRVVVVVAVGMEVEESSFEEGSHRAVVSRESLVLGSTTC